MKKEILLATVTLVSVTILSCRKNYDCECTYKNSGKKDVVETWQSNGMGNIGKKQLENRCSNTISNDTMTCVLK